MLRLAGGTHFLLVRSVHSVREIFCYPRFAEALAKADSYTRLSPVFPLEKAPAPAFESDSEAWLLFFGPVYPGDLNLENLPNAYLTLGLLNVLVFCTTQQEFVQARSVIDGAHASWEEWHLRGNRIVGVNHGTSRDPTAAPEDVSAELAGIPKPIWPTARECVALLVGALCRATGHGLSTADVIRRYNSVLRALLARSDVDVVEKLEFLVTTNVAMSRHLWQGYSGSDPILENPCHFATHSLLGVGTASLALENLVRFVEHAFELARIPTRLAGLSQLAPQSQPLIQIPSDAEFWNTDFLFNPGVKLASVDLRDDDDPPLPHITHFSGRDGFRSTLISLSAPVEVITGCNTSSWTLQTATHEMSHSLVRAVMGRVLPHFADREAVIRVKQVIDDPASARNLFEQLRAFLTYAIWVMHSGLADEQFDDADDFGTRIRQDIREADEILTHVLDFLYHYRRDPLQYVRSLWASWAMIPRLGDRIHEYLVRTLCALHSNNLRRDHGMRVTMDTFLECLGKVLRDLPDALYIPQALSELRNNPDRYLDDLRNRIPLVKFCRYFLYSPEVAKSLVMETEEVLSGETYRALLFTDQRITSPLRFIAELSKDKEPNTMRSVWMLQHLAHGVPR